MPEEQADIRYDVIVVGGGPSGMMAAGRAARAGARVLLLEKNSTLGKKLLITGGGRCNLTNAQPDEKVFFSKFGTSAKYLYSAFAQFSVVDTLEFFHKRKLYTKMEGEYRIFPTTEQAQSVLDVLKGFLEEHDVTIRTASGIDGFVVEDGRIVGVRLAKGGRVMRAYTFILATGGKSHPETGSTGEGFDWLRALGHTVVEPDPALVPIKIRGKFVKQLGGLSFDDVKLTIMQEGTKPLSQNGKFLFTHFGVSGPLVLNMSREVGARLKNGEVDLVLDMYPHVDHGTLDRQVQALFGEHPNKMIKNVIGHLVAPKMEETILSLCKVDPDTFINRLSREERVRIVHFLKGFRLRVQGLLGSEQAVVTSGGVALSEVDFKTMQSRKHANLFLVGDVLDIDRPSGGYSLQLCWTTGFVAGMWAKRVGRSLAKNA